MKDLIKQIIRPFVPQAVLNFVKPPLGVAEIEEWKVKGGPGPAPHIVKQETIAELQSKSGYNVLIETGTYLGDMVEAQKSRFKKVISIELGVDLFKKAQKRFINDKNVTIVQGDSGQVLSKILEGINEPCIFWLDGHYSAGITAKGAKECPIFEEIDAIFMDKKLNHILLIDDARCFVGAADYPTIQELTDHLKSKNINYQVEIKYDIIRCTI